jgi:RNA polymerase sigma-70 factor (ECF subfamily)
MAGMPGRAKFATTRWSLIAATHQATDSPDAQAALATLCETYWVPVYAFIRRSGHSPEDARDLAQGFFTKVIEKGYFRDADRTRGRFRTFLLTSVRHYMSNQRDAARTLKRGGTIPHISLEIETDDRTFTMDPPDTETPEHVYERRWALAILAGALSELQARYDSAPRARLFETLKPMLTGEDPSSYAALSAETGMSEGALRVALHRMRKQFAVCLRTVVRETVLTDEDVDDELRLLRAIVSR